MLFGLFMAVWFFVAYVLYEVGKRLGVYKSYQWYLIPIYNLWLIMKKINLHPLLLALFAVPLVNIIAYGYITGKMAKSLGKNEWLYGILIAILPFANKFYHAFYYPESFSQYALLAIFSMLPIGLLLVGNESKPITPPINPYPYNPTDGGGGTQKASTDGGGTAVALKLVPQNSIYPSISLHYGKTLSVGRKNYNDIVLNNELISSKHMEIYYNHNGLFIKDIGSEGKGSTNGTYVNGSRLTANVPRELKRKDVLLLAGDAGDSGVRYDVK